MIVDLDHPGIGKMPVSGIVIKLSKTPGDIETPVPKIGQHNMEIYHDLLGYTEGEIAKFKQQGII
jgi:crotonobetainyl-CoA:carnitine CoA-transferase CaiB-like acyl-CoA transferase